MRWFNSNSDKKWLSPSLLLFSISLVCLCLGYVMLIFANPTASNLPGILSPVLILGSFGGIVISILLKDI